MNENIKILQVSALEKSRVIKERCDSLTHQHHQSEVSIDLINIINNFCKYLDSCILKQTSIQIKIIQQIITILQKIGEEIQYIESGIMHKIPWGYIRPFQECIKNICHQEFKVLISARWNYNYSCVMQNISALYRYRLESFSGLGKDKYERRLRSNIKKLGQDLRIIEFPYLERMNILFHCLIGHEIGHIFAGEFIKEKQKEIVENIVKGAQIEWQKSPIDDLKKLKHVESMSYVLSRIFEEVLCDLFCVYIFGPASLFAIHDYAQHFELDSSIKDIIENHYPPWRYRLRKVYYLLDEMEI